MKCVVCNRRMRSGETCFECDGCGNICPFRPVADVLEELESNDEFVDGLLKDDEPVRHTPKKIEEKKSSPSKGKK